MGGRIFGILREAGRSNEVDLGQEKALTLGGLPNGQEVIAIMSNGLKNIDPKTLKERLDRGEVLLIDVRERSRERIAGAKHIPLSTIDPAKMPDAGGKQVILHCQVGMSSAKAAEKLLAAGWNEVTHLEGGLDAWKRDGLPVEKVGGEPISIPRQVQTTAGSLALIGLLLWWIVSPWWLLLTVWVGAGLLFSGVTGYCPMAALLARMPWNQRV